MYNANGLDATLCCRDEDVGDRGTREMPKWADAYVLSLYQDCCRKDISTFLRYDGCTDKYSSPLH